jgi:putative ATP-binding cassette transporter
MIRKTRQFLRDLWQLARPYWFSEEKGMARLLLVAVVGLNLALVGMDVAFNRWQNAFYNSLQDRNQGAFFDLMWTFCGLATAYIVLAVYQLYLNQMLQIRWRRWMTAQYVDRWLGDRAYYRMQLTDRGTDNPDQRIADDLRLFVEMTLSLTLGLLSAVVRLGSFIGILWVLSGPLAITLSGAEVNVPGYLVWVALAYAVVGTWLAHLIGRPLMRLQYQRQRVEADFRFALVRFRENGEGVALYRGEAGEKANFMERFAALADNWWEIMRRTKKLTWFSAGYGQIAIIFPYLVVAPRYFSGKFQLGDLMQTASAFGQMQGALSWFIDAYSRLAEWRATVDRLTGFVAATERARTEAAACDGIEQTTATGPAWTYDALRIELPGGRVLVDGTAGRFTPGEAVLVSGPSGSGKSTFFRALAGIWPFGKGRVGVPPDANVLFLPQRAYLPIGTLRSVLAYPGDPAAFGDPALRQALVDCELPHLAGRLDESEHWALALSPGEQQRIAFARALLQAPQWLFLDEASAALDGATEERLYRLVRERLPGTTIVSIGHRPALAKFHDRRLSLEARPGGGAFVSTPIPATA